MATVQKKLPKGGFSMQIYVFLAEKTNFQENF